MKKSSNTLAVGDTPARCNTRAQVCRITIDDDVVLQIGMKQLAGRLPATTLGGGTSASQAAARQGTHCC
eukprot:5642139-Amphidinium_carterae.1